MPLRKWQKNTGFRHGSEAGWYSNEVLTEAMQMKGASVTGWFPDEQPTRGSRSFHGLLIHDGKRQHWWAVREEEGKNWIHDSMLPTPLPCQKLDALLTQVWSNEGSVYIINYDTDMNWTTERYTLEHNQALMTPPQFQVKKDEVLARKLGQLELAKSWRDSPPPFKGPSPKKNSADNSNGTHALGGRAPGGGCCNPAK